MVTRRQSWQSRLALLCAVLGFVLIAGIDAVYDEATPVTVLDDKSIKKELKKDGVYLVEFFAPWCGHCKNLKPEWEKTAKALDGLVTVAAIDVDTNKEAGSKYSIKSLPTIKAISISKGKVDFEEEYTGKDRTAKGFSMFALKSAKAAIDHRLGTKKKGSKKKSSSSSSEASSSGFYGSVEEVVDLTGSNFDKLVKKSDQDWFLEFYAPWCGHCKNLKKDWISAAKKMKGKVNFGAVDCDQAKNKALCSEYGIKGFPTIKYKRPGKKPKDYKGARDAKSIGDYANNRYKGEPEPEPTPPPPSGAGFYDKEPDVVDLSTNSFEKEIKGGKDQWFVEFYAPWCGHCKNLSPAWISAAKELKGKVNFGAVNCDTEDNKSGVCRKMGIQGFPTLKYFIPGKGFSSYQESRTAEDLIKFANRNYKKSVAEPVLELKDQAVFEENCLGSKTHMCVVTFLPDILDTQAEGRNKYLEVLKGISQSYASMPYSYFWTAAGLQSGLEGSFNVGGFGYPAVVLYSPRKKIYTTLKGGFSHEEISELINTLRRGKAQVQSIQGDESIAALETVVPWDGKDGVVQAEDEFSLDDLGIETASHEEL
jgi:protein disulfide-isomerase A6